MSHKAEAFHLDVIAAIRFLAAFHDFERVFASPYCLTRENILYLALKEDRVGNAGGSGLQF